MSHVDTVISAFSAEHVTQITGLSNRQLSYWDKTGFFAPQYASIGDGRSAVRVYSFRDVVSLRTLKVLLTVHKVSLQHLRLVAERLSHYSDAPFAELQLMVFNREVVFKEPETGISRGVVSGQYVLLPIVEVIREVQESASALNQRAEYQIGRIERHRYVSHNSPVVAGTRIPVRAILHFIEDGFSVDAILQEYPLLTKADVDAVVNISEAQRAA